MSIWQAISITLKRPAVDGIFKVKKCFIYRIPLKAGKFTARHEDAVWAGVGRGWWWVAPKAAKSE